MKISYLRNFREVYSCDSMTSIFLAISLLVGAWGTTGQSTVCPSQVAHPSQNVQWMSRRLFFPQITNLYGRPSWLKIKYVMDTTELDMLIASQDYIIEPR